MRKKEIAVEKFMKGYNCCQAVACAYCEDFGIPERDMLRLTEGFGSGIGGLGDTCGAIMGVFLIISLSNSAGDMEQPKLTKFDTYGKILDAAAAYREKMGSLYCRDLKTEDGPQPLPGCIRCVAAGAEILDEYFEAREQA